MARAKPPATRIARHTDAAIFVRGRNLVDELIGRIGFTEMIFLQLMGRAPDPAQVRVLDAVLVTLMEHGMTPSAISARLTYMSAPEALQGAVAAGLLGVGGQFVGTIEQAAALIERVRAAGADAEAEAAAIAGDHRARRAAVPGFGHHLHRPDDPRSPRLFAVAAEAGVAGDHIAALRRLAAAVDAAWGRHITINATGAVAAVLGEIGVPVEIMRGIALISRAAGLVGHLREEQQDPAGRVLWDAAAAAVPYEDGGDAGSDDEDGAG